MLLTAGITLLAQQPASPIPQAGAPPAQSSPVSNPVPPAPPDSIRPNYVLGPNDQVLVRLPQLEEINEKPFRIDAEGFINMPPLGRIRAGGMTVQEFEADVSKRAREYVREPQVAVNVIQFRSEPVSFQGAFQKPGIYALQGRRTLTEMLVTVGGLQPNTTRRIKITRHSDYGVIPLPNAVVDPDKKVSTAEVSLASLQSSLSPAEDIVLEPYDVVSVERAEPVYVYGEVARVGSIELGERDSISVMQALTQSGGLQRDADQNGIRILRPISNTTKRAEIDVDMKRILDGKENDMPLLPNDVLYVPRNGRRQALTLASTVALPIVLSTILTLALR